MDITNLSVEQLRQAAQIKSRIESLNAQLARIAGSSGASLGTATKGSTRKMSAAARAKIAAAQRTRWTKQRGKPAVTPKKGRRQMSAAAKAKISAAAKARWQKVRAQRKKSL